MTKKLSPEEIFEKIITDTIKATKKKPFKIKTTLSLVISGELVTNPHGESEIDDLEVKLEDLQGDIIGDELLSTTGEVIADSINYEISEGSTNVIPLDVMYEKITTSLDALETKTAELEESLDENKIDWSEWTTTDDAYLWEAVASEVEYRTGMTINHAAPATSAPTTSAQAAPASIRPKPAPQPTVSLATSLKQDGKEPPRAFAASAVKTPRQL